MDIWGNYKSKLGYLAGDSKIDTYGVDHSKFSLRDETDVSLPCGIDVVFNFFFLQSSEL